MPFSEVATMAVLSLRLSHVAILHYIVLLPRALCITDVLQLIVKQGSPPQRFHLPPRRDGNITLITAFPLPPTAICFMPPPHIPRRFQLSPREGCASSQRHRPRICALTTIHGHLMREISFERDAGEMMMRFYAIRAMPAIRLRLPLYHILSDIFTASQRAHFLHISHYRLSRRCLPEVKALHR